MLDRVLPGIEPTFSNVLAVVLGEEGMKVYTEARAVRLGRKGARERRPLSYDSRSHSPESGIEMYALTVSTSFRSPLTWLPNSGPLW